MLDTLNEIKHAFEPATSTQPTTDASPLLNPLGQPALTTTRLDGMAFSEQRTEEENERVKPIEEEEVEEDKSTQRGAENVQEDSKNAHNTKRNSGVHLMADGTMMAHDDHGKQSVWLCVRQSNSDMWMQM